MTKINLDGKELEVESGRSIMDIAKESGVYIPTLCHHDAVKPYGACRLCLVEISTGRRTRIVASCIYPVQEDIIIKTNTERIKKSRRMIIELLLARCPEPRIIRELAGQMGIKKSRFKSENDECMLCGLCVRVCHEIVGVSAIGFGNRGTKREVLTPFSEASDACIGCGSCVYVCPTGAIKMVEKKGKRIFPNWKTEFKLRKCETCGNYFAPEFQLQYLQKKYNLPENYLTTCLSCQR